MKTSDFYALVERYVHCVDRLQVEPSLYWSLRCRRSKERIQAEIARFRRMVERSRAAPPP